MCVWFAGYTRRLGQFVDATRDCMKQPSRDVRILHLCPMKAMVDDAVRLQHVGDAGCRKGIILEITCRHTTKPELRVLTFHRAVEDG